MECRAGGLHAALGGLPGGTRTRRCGFCLGHVGAGDLADPKPVVGGLKLPVQHLLVVDVELKQLLGLDDVNVIGDHVGEDELLGGDQPATLAQYPIFRLVGLRLRPAAGIDRLGNGCVGGQGFTGRLYLGRGLLHRSSTAAVRAADDDRRPPSRECLRHLFVHRAQGGPRGKQGGIGAVSGGQRLLQGVWLGLCPCRGGYTCQAQPKN